MEKNQCHSGLTLVVKKEEKKGAVQEPIRNTASGLFTYKIHDNQTPAQCFSVSPSILAYIKKGQNLEWPLKNARKWVTLSRSALTEHFSLTSAVIFFSEQGHGVQSLPCITCPSGGLQAVLLTAPSNAIGVAVECVIQPKELRSK